MNADFTRRVVEHADYTPWRPSPMPGAERKMLDRIGGEVARAATIQRVAPGSTLSAHTHEGGEALIVLHDAHGDVTAGSDIRDPPRCKHTPLVAPGATIMLKLHRFQPENRAHIPIATDKACPVAAANRPGVAVPPLFDHAHKVVGLET
ncbi:MAG: cupin domain-containing protein [Pseudomonadota bacterium]